MLFEEISFVEVSFENMSSNKSVRLLLAVIVSVMCSETECNPMFCISFDIIALKARYV